MYLQQNHMKQIILIGVLSGLLTATIPLRAQIAQRDSDARKGSRLELGRVVPTPKTSSSLPSHWFSLAPSSKYGLDRSISLNKNSAISAHYQSLLIKPAKTAAAKPAARNTSGDITVATAGDARPSLAQETKEESLYNSEKLWVSNVYPNPADDVAEVDYQFNGAVSEAKLILLNVLGTPVSSHELDRNDRKVRIATRNLDTGYYLYQLTVDGKKVATKRLLVRHQ